jgi:site-specific DNA recombinase
MIGGGNMGNVQNKKGKRCYIYTRVSTAMQVDGFSLDAQKEKMNAYAKYEGMSIVGEYSDEGKSGKNVEGRPDFRRMLCDIESGKDNVDFVLVFKLSRFGRNAADVLYYLQQMQDYGVNLICVDDNIDSSADSGKLIISVLSAVAEIERDNILVQTMEGRKQKAREGKWNGGFAPYGYNLQNGELKIAEDEVEIIKVIYDKYINTTMGVNAVADYLNMQGYRKKIRQNNTLETFNTSFVKGVLDNPVYCGKLAYGRRKTEKKPGVRNQYHIVKQDDYMVTEGIHEAIISEEDWQLAHQKRLNNGVKQIKTHSLDHEHILSGILKCPICGKGMYGNVNRKKKGDGTYYKDYFYYACKHRSFIDGKKCWYNHQWGEDIVNAAVAELICKLVQNPKFQSAIKEKINGTVDTQTLENELSNLLKEKRKKETAISRLGTEIDALDPSDRLYSRKYDDKQIRLEKLYDDLNEMESNIERTTTRLDNIKQKRLSGESVYKFLLYFDKLYDKFTDIQKKEFMKSFVKEVNIYEESRSGGQFLKNIKFKFPVYYDGKEVEEISWDNESTVETVVLLQRKDM